MNLMMSCGPREDEELAAKGHEFLGAGRDQMGTEVHVFRAAGKLEEPESDGDDALLPAWVDRHSVNCYFCGRLFDEREGVPADEWNGGDGGTACPECAKVKERAT